MSRRRRANKPAAAEVTIDAISHEGRGIAHIDGKTVFVSGALPGETVRMQVYKSNRKYDQATTVEIIDASPRRIEPRCAAFKTCGGCSLQYLQNADQLQLKQDALLDLLKQAGVEPDSLIPPLSGANFGYRSKARLGVKYVAAKGRVLVGFRERSSAYIADMHRCEVLIPKLGQRLDLLSEMLGRLDARAQIPQIEVAADARNLQLVFRHLQPLSLPDRTILADFGREHGFFIQLQSGGPNTLENLYPGSQNLSFDPVGDGALSIDFGALDFVQVNSAMNQQMVAQALEFLNLKATDRVLDLYCGLGNFTLPIAQRCCSVTGIEVDMGMVSRARESAKTNQVENSDFHQVDLAQPDVDQDWMQSRYDKILLDPPRCGAPEMAAIMHRFEASRILYISCQPASLARDAAIICSHGYQLKNVGIMDMFPHTAHVESMAVFELNTAKTH